MLSQINLSNATHVNSLSNVNNSPRVNSSSYVSHLSLVNNLSRVNNLPHIDNSFINSQQDSIPLSTLITQLQQLIHPLLPI